MAAEEIARNLEPAYDTVHIDPPDTIDAILLEAQYRTIAQQLPTAAEQNLLVAGVQQRDELAARRLVSAHSGLIATVAHLYKQPEIPSGALLRLSSRALLEAARTYRRNEEMDFGNFAVLAIQGQLERLIPSRHPEVSSPNDRPMDRIFRYMAELQPAINKEATNQKVLEPFTPLQRRVLPLLLLPYKEIATHLNVPSPHIVKRTVAAARKNDKAQVNAPNPPALVLELRRRGFTYDVGEPKEPLVEILNNTEMDIGNLLGHTYDDIAALTHLDRESIGVRFTHMRAKLGIRTNTELALIMDIFDIGERRKFDSRPPSQELEAKLGVTSLEGHDLEQLLTLVNPYQRQVITAFYLSGEDVSMGDVGRQFNTDRIAVNRAAERGLRTMRNYLQRQNSHSKLHLEESDSLLTA